MLRRRPGVYQYTSSIIPTIIMTIIIPIINIIASQVPQSTPSKDFCSQTISQIVVSYSSGKVTSHTHLLLSPSSPTVIMMTSPLWSVSCRVFCFYDVE